ncbi:thioredoxin family protein [Asticcacaulis solisilvae]|uniref:thioredoxin family protein n=1 Tax=Asticcacaulis solisilvae TaxID=1217274 RepID=UPI003FD8C1EF
MQAANTVLPVPSRDLDTITGVVVFSLMECEPCEVLSDVLAREEFRTTAITIFELNPLVREDRAFIRANAITAFPTLVKFENGAEVKRLVGVNPLDPPELIVDYVMKYLIQ